MADHDLVILEDGTIRQLALRGDVVAAFPFLQVALSPQAVRRRCAKCGRNRNGGSDAIDQIKRVLSAMGGQQKLKFKALLNANRVRVTFRNNAGQAQVKEF